jgi:hypothetical protein
MRKISSESLFTNKEPVIDAEPVTSKDPVMTGENNLINLFCYKYVKFYGTKSNFVNPSPIACVLEPPYGFAVAVAVNADVGVVKFPA